jgi:hypothetical protein
LTNKEREDYLDNIIAVKVIISARHGSLAGI